MVLATERRQYQTNHLVALLARTSALRESVSVMLGEIQLDLGRKQ